MLFRVIGIGGGSETLDKKIRAYGTYAGLGIQLGATAVVFCFLGVFLDNYLGSSPWFTLLGTFIGAAGAFYSIYRKLFPGKPKQGE